MSLDDIKKISLPAAEDCVLWLWTTQKFLPDTFEIMKLWGFEYKATLVWNKKYIGLGSWLRLQVEFCLLGIKGSVGKGGKLIWNLVNERDIITEQRTKHSKKPESFYELVDRLTPIGRKLDYFSRQQREGFITVGTEIDKFDPSDRKAKGMFLRNEEERS
jgi:N6-adenosine-specific RNA methylase IME4